MLPLAGAAISMGLVVATDALRHPRLRLPAPLRRSQQSSRTSAAATPCAATVAAPVAALAGETSSFAAHSTWILLGMWIARQPHVSVTRHVALQRGAGTALGALLTLVLVVAVPHGLWLGWLFLALAFVAFGLRTVNYAWYCVLLTPIVVRGFGDAPLDIQVLLARVAWTAAGVALAVLARHVLWHREPAPAAALAVSV